MENTGQRKTTIPTLPDMMRDIDNWMAARATGEEIPHDLQSEVERLIDAPGLSVDHLFMCMAAGRGCHTVAEERRQRDDFGNAFCYHHFGQILIEHAIRMLAQLAHFRIAEETLH